MAAKCTKPLMNLAVLNCLVVPTADEVMPSGKDDTQTLIPDKAADSSVVSGSYSPLGHL